MLATHLAKPLGFLILALTVLLPRTVVAQTDTASIVGTVKDGSGAVMPGVTVTATQAGTDVALTTTTNASGQYVFPTLRIGTYSVAAELQGFRRTVRSDVLLNVQDRVEINLTLEVGQLAEEVQVKGETPLLQTETANIGYSGDERQLKDLPLLGRRYAELAFLTPGVVSAPPGITSRGEDTFFNSNGNYATWNNFMLDGADNNSGSTNLQERSLQVIQPPVDALQEFKVQTRTYSAEFGKAAGAIINASIKQGSNKFRGSVYEFFRDEAFNANLWDNNRANRAKGAFNQHIPGGTLGGPIVRDRTFFFGDYQGTRTEQAQSNLSVVPTALMRQGNLTELSTALTNSQFIPAGCVDTANKIINATCIDPVARAIQNYYPLPNIASELAKAGVPGSFGNVNYISNAVLNTHINQFDTRIDHTFGGGHDQLFGRYSYMNTHRMEPPALDDPIANGNFASDIVNRGQSFVVGWSRIIGNSLFNEFRGAWNWIDSDVVHTAFGIDVNSQIGLTGVPTDPRYSGGIPFVTIQGGFTRIGGPFFRPQFQTSQVYQFADNLTWTKATHTFKFGLERRRDILDYIDLQSLNGTVNFNDGRYSGAGYGDFLLGLASMQGITLFHEADLFSDGWQAYAQDSWRLTSDLTLNYGLRYEYFTPSQARDHALTNIDPATGEILTSKDSGSIYDQTLIHPDRNDWAPRVGVAYSLTRSLVVRAGYGIFYQQQDRYGSESQLALNPPQLIDVSLAAASAAVAPVMTLRSGFVPVTAANVNKSAIMWRIQDANQRTPMVHQFSGGIEYQLSPTMVADVEYVGNRTRDGRKLNNLNQGIIGPGNVVTFPYAQYGFGSAYLEQIATNGKADYNALQMRLQRRFSNGLAFTTSFTYSRAKGNFLDHLSAGNGATGNVPLNRYDIAADYGPLPFDIPKRFVTSFIYELPVGKAHAFNPGGVSGAILRDWSVNGILTLSDGRPFSVGATDRANTGGGRTTRANCVGDPVPDGFDQTVDHWMDINAFASLQPFTYGNCPYNNVRGPGFKSLNASIFRSFPWGDRRFEFRLETFNLFNNVNFGFPGNNVNTPASFGKITSTIGNPREMQLAVKLYF
ncbi:MAG TPA: TonB-dependent receptor [Vicinamibacterales bacterium]|nr:TonB-dependent receptor [Vicinamibacterales bacterium]